MVETQIKLSGRAQMISDSATLAVTAKAAEMKKRGIDVVSFGAGEPDFDTPQNIKDAGIEAIQDGFTKYTAAAGMPELRNAIREKLRRENGLEYEIGQIVVSCGAKHSLYNIFMAICDPGDEVVIQAPYWVSYTEMVRMAGGVPVIIETTMESEFKMTPSQLETALTPRTKAVIINSPSNPTGTIYSPAELRALADVLEKHSVYVVSDEIYEHLAYDGVEVRSIASVAPALKDRVFVVNGVSKTYSMTGWRIGYTAGPLAAMKAISNIQSHSTSAPAHFAQIASIEALTGTQDSVSVMAEEFRKRRDYMVARLNSIDGIECFCPKGAFYVFPRISRLYGREIGGKIVQNSLDFCAQMLEVGKVAMVPGSGFGADDFVRLSYATSMEAITEGLNRIEAALS